MFCGIVCLINKCLFFEAGNCIRNAHIKCRKSNKDQSINQGVKSIVSHYEMTL